MSVLEWAYLFKDLMDLTVKFFNIEVFVGTGITFMDIFLFIGFATILLYGAFRIYDQ